MSYYNIKLYHIYIKTIDFLTDNKNNNRFFKEALYNMYYEEKYIEIRDYIYNIHNLLTSKTKLTLLDIELYVENILLKPCGVNFCKELLGIE